MPLMVQFTLQPLVRSSSLVRRHHVRAYLHHPWQSINTSHSRDHGYDISPDDQESAHKGTQSSPHTKTKLSRFMLFVWQASLMSLSYSIIWYVAELTAVVINPLLDEPKWSDAAKV